MQVPSQDRHSLPATPCPTSPPSARQGSHLPPHPRCSWYPRRPWSPHHHHGPGCQRPYRSLRRQQTQGTGCQVQTSCAFAHVLIQGSGGLVFGQGRTRSRRGVGKLLRCGFQCLWAAQRVRIGALSDGRVSAANGVSVVHLEIRD
jgi:hypothetical protein